MLKPPLRAIAPTVRRVGSNLALRMGLYGVGGTIYAGSGVIYMLHRVVAPGQPIVYPGYTVSGDTLDTVLRTVRELGWDIVTLDEAYRRIHEGGRRFTCFTLDDGYVDNLTVALPVFRKHGAPFCVYVTTGFLDRSVDYWWGALEEFVLRSSSVTVPATPGKPERRLSAVTLEEKVKAFEELDRIGHKCPDVFPQVRDAVRGAGISVEALLDRDALSIEQLRQFAADPLVTIGSHCVRHTRLAPLSDEAAAAEIGDSRRVLEHLLQRDVKHLAYPYGGPAACGSREFGMAAAHYRTAVTTRMGNIFPGHKAHMHSLPRREIPLTAVALRNTLFGLESLLRRQPRFQAA